MDNFDELFISEKEQEENKTYRSYNKDEWAEKKRSEKNAAFELLDEGTKDISSNCEKFRDYLNVQAHFDRYSVSNAILIAEQMPQAKQLRSFEQWKENNVTVNKGEKSIMLLMPGNEYTKSDGTTGFSVRVKRVFDVSQTSQNEDVVVSTDADKRKMIQALIKIAPCDIKMVDSLPDSLAQYSPEDNVIYICQGLEGDDIFRALTQEYVYVKDFLHENENQNTAFKAYCTSYVLCERYKFSTDNFVFEAVPNELKGKQPKEIRNHLEAIRSTANEIGADVNRVLEAIEKDTRNNSDAR